VVACGGSEAFERLIAMLAAYFDESGTHQGSGFITMAGYISPVGDWKRFQTQWTKTLLRAGLAPSVPFHMADLVARRPPFDWPDRKRDAVLKNLIGIPARAGLAASWQCEK
jgi:hypothetical protein